MTVITMCHRLRVMQNFLEVIDLWPSVLEFAQDIGKKPNLIRKWKERDSIPSDAWLSIISAAQYRGLHGVTAEVLTEIASRRNKAEAA